MDPRRPPALTPPRGRPQVVEVARPVRPGRRARGRRGPPRPSRRGGAIRDPPARGETAHVTRVTSPGSPPSEAQRWAKAGPGSRTAISPGTIDRRRSRAGSCRRRGAAPMPRSATAPRARARSACARPCRVGAGVPTSSMGGTRTPSVTSRLRVVGQGSWTFDYARSGRRGTLRRELAHHRVQEPLAGLRGIAAPSSKAARSSGSVVSGSGIRHPGRRDRREVEPGLGRPAAATPAAGRRRPPGQAQQHPRGRAETGSPRTGRGCLELPQARTWS